MSSMMQSKESITAGVKAKKMKPSATEKNRTSAVIVMPKKDGGWKDIRNYLDDTEKKLSQFGDRIEGLTSRMESKAKGTRGDIEKYYRGFHRWLSQKIDKIRSFEASTETWYDTALVKGHLAKMEASDAAGELVKRLDKVKLRVERMVH